jgi:hypothetical protein
LVLSSFTDAGLTLGSPFSLKKSERWLFGMEFMSHSHIRRLEANVVLEPRQGLFLLDSNLLAIPSVVVQEVHNRLSRFGTQCVPKPRQEGCSLLQSEIGSGRVIERHARDVVCPGSHGCAAGLGPTMPRFYASHNDWNIISPRD